VDARDVATLRVDGGFAARRSVYRAIAQALAGAEPPAGAVFETSLAGPPATIWVRPARLLGPRGAADLVGAVATFDPSPSDPSEPPLGRRSAGQFGMLLPSGTARTDRSVPTTVPSPLLPVAWVAPVGGWAGVQVLWRATSMGPVHVAVRFRIAAREPEDRASLFRVVGARLLTDWTRGTGTIAVIGRASHGARRDWRRLGIRSLPGNAWHGLAPEVLDAIPEVGFRDLERPSPTSEGHTVVFGASGTGKTTLLAERARRAIAGGRPVVVLDLHGDLTPAILRNLLPVEREQVVAVDAGVRPVAGISGLVRTGSSVDRAAGHFVAAVKRLSPDGGELAWGFRLERIFDTFSRLVLESGGTLVDLYALLTDPRRREAAVLESHGPAATRFLEELAPIVRRNPEFLWSAATRLSKVVLVPELADLLAPGDGGLEVEHLVRSGRSLLVRIPVATLGPEVAAFAATLVLGRIYLGLVGSPPLTNGGAPVLLVLDEVQGFPPRLVSEILSESRKFGLEAIVATQYPDRLSPEVRDAASGAAANFVTFRTPAASASHVGPWVGLRSDQSAPVLTSLPVGVALALEPNSPEPRWLQGAKPSVTVEAASWGAAVDRTRFEFGVASTLTPIGVDEEPVERVLLAILGAEERADPLACGSVVEAAGQLAGPPLDGAELERAWDRLERGAECSTVAGRVRLTAAGEQRLGLGAHTGAVSESAEHRALLLRAFRVFARRGYAIEILRQGRFDTTLPDAVFRQLGTRARTVPAEVARVLDGVRSGWAWRCFSGLDVHLEAEVSGALRSERIRRGWAKAKARGAFALFLVGDAGRARRVRSTLRALGLGPGRAQVWTLKPSPTSTRSGIENPVTVGKGVSPPDR
jgi:hypothetical protein